MVDLAAGKTPALPYRLVVYQEADGSWACEIPNLPGFAAGADTWADLLGEIEDALEAWLAHTAELGRPIPEPQGAQ